MKCTAYAISVLSKLFILPVFLYYLPVIGLEDYISGLMQLLCFRNLGCKRGLKDQVERNISGAFVSRLVV